MSHQETITKFVTLKTQFSQRELAFWSELQAFSQYNAAQISVLYAAVGLKSNQVQFMSKSLRSFVRNGGPSCLQRLFSLCSWPMAVCCFGSWKTCSFETTFPRSRASLPSILLCIVFTPSESFVLEKRKIFMTAACLQKGQKTFFSNSFNKRFRSGKKLKAYEFTAVWSILCPCQDRHPWPLRSVWGRKGRRHSVPKLFVWLSISRKRNLNKDPLQLGPVSDT